ncbi:bifunctional riboflavin kinase/FAD synthetase [Knoellia sp. S7-12]|uniref:bifunctional riboflavin kinase/FAD synthetase n=1 Tax=Knoellia sp. S7-12 TaxID=3126698 RepID=UPI003368E49D
MHRFTDPAETPDELAPCVVTLGNFDGVHRGHKAVLSRLIEIGRERGLPAVAVTFDPHPLAVLHPDRAPEIITPSSVRDDLLETTGLSGLLVLEFTKDFAQQSPEEFVKSTFVDGLQAKVVVVGVDTRFGYKNSGDVATLLELGRAHGFDVIALEDVGEGERWSSTSVRNALAEGDVAAAARVLGRPHRVVGTVVHGHHRGREMGYPTANLSPDSAGLVPAEGVYAGWLTRLDLEAGEPDRTMPSAISIGTNPTFDTMDRRTVEAYVLDRDDLDLYDERVVVEFVEHIRPTLRFDSIDDLLVAMSKDVEQCRAVLTQIVHS